MCLLEDLRVPGPFAPIFGRRPQPERPVDWLGGEPAGGGEEALVVDRGSKHAGGSRARPPSLAPSRGVRLTSETVEALARRIAKLVRVDRPTAHRAG